MPVKSVMKIRMSVPKGIFILLCFFHHLLYSQVVVKGKVTDFESGEPLPGVHILFDKGKGFVTANDGSYLVKCYSDSVQIQFRYIGYKTQNFLLSIQQLERQGFVLNVRMQQESHVLDQVVITAGRYEQKLSDVTVTMQVIQPQLIENTHTSNLETAINRMPGLEVIDGQANIRNGSGWSYGAGSRVLLLLDDLPMLSGDAGDIKWNFLPVENIARVEILKGASSALFGSSALNGVINIRTSRPSMKPSTSITTETGWFLNPKRKELIWWNNRRPYWTGMSFSHLQKFGSTDLVVSGNYYNNSGYRKDNTEERGRISIFLQHRNQQIKGMTYGFNTSLMRVNITDFMLWQNDSNGAYIQNPATITPNSGLRLHFDPFIVFVSANGTKHHLKTRWFYVDNRFPGDKAKNNRSGFYFAEYQFYKNIFGHTDIAGGLLFSSTQSVSNMFGNHDGRNFALFGQADRKLKKLSLSAGLRWENFWLDNNSTSSKPVVRTGINYQVATYTFLRASFGQGFRYPTIAEKYTLTTVGGLNIFPNPRIAPETGWSTETGIRQGIKISDWSGFIDLAAFWTEYNNMMEFNFGFYDTITYLPTTQYFTFRNMGFQSQNIGMARITGVDITITGQGKIFGWPANLLVGYTYSNPVDLNKDSAYRAGKSDDKDILKYRNYHSAKADLELSRKKLSFGGGLRYNSFMEVIDRIFTDPILGNMLLPGFPRYRQLHAKGQVICDIRIAYNLTETARISVMMDNVFNKEYVGRPGDMKPPRSVSLQMSMKM